MFGSQPLICGVKCRKVKQYLCLSHHFCHRRRCGKNQRISLYQFVRIFCTTITSRKTLILSEQKCSQSYFHDRDRKMERNEQITMHPVQARTALSAFDRYKLWMTFQSRNSTKQCRILLLIMMNYSRSTLKIYLQQIVAQDL